MTIDLLENWILKTNTSMILDSESDTVLELIGKTASKTNEVVNVVNGLDFSSVTNLSNLLTTLQTYTNGELTTRVETTEETASSNYTTLDNKINLNQTNIEDVVSSNYAELGIMISSNYSTLSGSIASNVATIGTRIDTLIGRNIINVKNFGAVGDGVTDDTVAIQSAINYINTRGGGGLLFPFGIYLTGKITIYNNVYLIGEGRGSTIKLKNGVNDNLIEGYLSPVLWGLASGLDQGLTNYGLIDIELDGNRSNNSFGSCIAVYGQEILINNVSIKNAPEHGIRTEFWDGIDSFGMEGFVSNLKIDNSGKNGWWFKGPHDISVIGLVIIDAGQLSHNTYDGLLLEGNSNGRFFNAHVWSRSNTSNRHRYAVNDQSGGNEFIGCHFEGAYSANVMSNCFNGESIYSSCRIYAPWNGKNVIIKQPTIIIGTEIGDNTIGVPEPVGIILGENSSDNATNCLIQIHGKGNQLGFIDFTNSKGNNDITVKGYNPSGVAYIGTPAVSDNVQINVLGITGGNMVQKSGFGLVGSTGWGTSGTTQNTAQALDPNISCFSVTTSTAGQGVRLFPCTTGLIQIQNNSPNTINVYPEVGGQIGTSPTNTPVTLIPGQSAIFTRLPVTNQWAFMNSYYVPAYVAIPWTVYTPTVTSLTGLLTTTTATGRYEVIGKSCKVEILATITSLGTGAGGCRITLPFNASGFKFVLAGREDSVSGKAVQGKIAAGVNYIDAYLYDGTTPLVSGAGIILSGVYEIA